LFCGALNVLLVQHSVKNMGDKLLELRINITFAVRFNENATDRIYDQPAT